MLALIASGSMDCLAEDGARLHPRSREIVVSEEYLITPIDHDGPSKASVVEAFEGHFKERGVAQCIGQSGEHAAARDMPASTVSPEWKESASARIEQHRKADMSIRVVDRKGNPVTHAQVRVRMTKHAFPFGTMVNSKVYLDKGHYADLYRRSVKAFGFNAVTQTIYWNQQWDHNVERQQKEANERYTREGFEVRGHTVIYPRWRNTPDPISRLSNPDARSAISDHIGEVSTRMNGWYTDWDLVNEMFGHMGWIDSMGGMASLAKWHQISKAKSPETKIYYNHNGMISSTKNAGYRQSIFDMIKIMKEKKLIDGIGIEGHLNEDSPSPESIYSYLDWYSTLQLPIRITEFDLSTKDSEKHAQRFGDYLTIFFSHPNVSGITLWGFIEGRMWQERLGLVTPEGEMLPAGEVYRKLVLNEWWTDTSGTTDSTGKLHVRGFLGDYDVTATVNGKTARGSCSLTKDGVEVSISTE